MRKLWIFGDSFSVHWKNIQHSPLKDYAVKFKPEHHFTDIVCKMTGCLEIENHSVQGFCNYSILESIGTHIEKISSNDIVIIGWSSILRWRSIRFEPNKWTVISPNFLLNKNINKSTKEAFEEVFNRDSQLVVNELNSWINIINLAIKCKTLHWTPFQEEKKLWNLNMITPNFKIERINQISSIKDKHISSNGHLSVGNWMVNVLEYNFEPIDKII